MATLTTATPRNAEPVELRRALDMVDFFAGLVEAASLNRMAIAARGTNIPVVIVAGFLGAGKTTLMRHVLTANHGMKIAAMVNDFAALNIDAALIAEVSGDVTALANGCVCCSLSGGIARGLTGIIDRPETLDAVLIEASGVSDPAGIALVAGTLRGISLDCIVTVVDAAENPVLNDWLGLLARQVAPANLVLLNKTDLVDAKHVNEQVAHLAKLAPNAQILRTVNCAVPPAVIFQTSGRRAFIDDQTAPTEGHDFKTMILTPTKPVDRAALEDTLRTLPDGIVRIKGFVNLIDGDDRPELLQCVGRRWSWHPAPVESCIAKLVVIGQTSAMSGENILRHFGPLGFKRDEASN